MQTTDLDATKQVVRKFVDRVFVHQDPAAADALGTEDFTAHTCGPMPAGRDALKTGMARAGAGVSDAEFTIHDLIAEDDRVAARLTTTARHTGDFMGLPPT